MGMPEDLSARFLEREEIARNTKPAIKTSIPFDDWCPFLLCLEDTPHVHNRCPECNAIRYGNLGCMTCSEFWSFIRKPQMDGETWSPFTWGFK